MNKKVTGIVAYIGIIGWLIAFLAGDKENAKFHLNQALVLAIVGIANSVLSWIIGILSLFVPFLGIVSWLFTIIGVIVFVFSIIGIVYAAKEEDKALPVIGSIKILK